MTALEFKQVSKVFKDGHREIEALKETNFSIQSGEFVAVIGPSGSGKSTFLTIAGGLQAPSSGEVKINNQEFSSKKEKERSSIRFDQIGFILQSSNLVPFLTVEKQLILVDKINKDETQNSKTDLFERLGVADLKNNYPSELSGGERQRIAIARALYNDPTLILADEPTASLDTERALEVVELLAKESKENNKATIMVTHDTRLLDQCDKVYEMNDGILKER